MTKKTSKVEDLPVPVVPKCFEGVTIRAGSSRYRPVPLVIDDGEFTAWESSGSAERPIWTGTVDAEDLGWGPPGGWPESFIFFKSRDAAAKMRSGALPDEVGVVVTHSRDCKFECDNQSTFHQYESADERLRIRVRRS